VRWLPAWELVSWSNELGVRQLPVSEGMNTEAEEATAWKLLLVMSYVYKCSVNPDANPKPIY
jgi:hypothetical protein